MGTDNSTTLPPLPENQTLPFVLEIIERHFPQRDPRFMTDIFSAVSTLFAGKYPGYHHSDAAYHNFTHTSQAAEAVARIADGHIRSGQTPRVTVRDLELAIAAILLHDIGYLKEAGDEEGTGAKYTLCHVKRSVEFAQRFMPKFGVSADECRVLGLAIYSTGVNVNMQQLGFQTPQERWIGCALGSGDMLAQMAAPDYPERLPALYREYAEAVAYSKISEGGIASYRSPQELMRRTRDFYQGYAQRMLNQDWGNVHQSLTHHFPDGRHVYLEQLEAKLVRIDALIAKPQS